MSRLFKLCGLFMLFSAFSAAGFYKSYLLKRRYRKLQSFYRSLSDLKERIRLNSGEISRLVMQSFGSDIVANNGVFAFDEIGLNKEDIKLMSDFFSNLGMSDSESECERIEIYMSLILKNCTEAELKCRELCRLYNSLGILCGIFICIFFL